MKPGNRPAGMVPIPADVSLADKSRVYKSILPLWLSTRRHLFLHKGGRGLDPD